MDAGAPQFVGPPCGQYGAHTFYRGFRYVKEGKTKDIGLGEFFFVRISGDEDPCIGELQLLCSNRNNDQHLSSIRLYFLPEQTPDGRLSHHGEHEVLVASDRVVLKLDDLVSWITDEVEWNHGIIAPHSKGPKEEEPECNGTVPPAEKSPPEVKDPSSPKETEQGALLTSDTKVVVLSYQSYCRYRTMLKRLEGGDTSEWLLNQVVVALGGYRPPSTKTHVLFCRDNFEHDELAHHELNCEYLAPTVKGKRRKRKTKNTRSISPESNTSEECKTIDVKNQKVNGLKQPPVKNEQEFLQRLFKFMKKRNTPIHRVPHLGFKQIDLYVFFSFAQKLGGYDKITTKKLWKHVYDELGGNPGSTSAATCTRRHYERLLLPFERFIEGIVYKPAQRGKKGQKKKQQSLEEDEEREKDGTANPSPIKSEPNNNTSISAEAEDAYTFTDSNHENSNSKDSNSNAFTSVGDDQTNTNDPPFSDEDSKTVWSIQKQPDSKDETDKDESKAIKPLIIQKGQSESFAEKERKWDEIRRKNAAARKWVRQSRSNRGCKTPIPEIPPFKHEKAHAEPENSDLKESPQKVKPEITSPPPCPSLPANNGLDTKPIADIKVEVTLPSENHTVPPKFLSPVVAPEVHAPQHKIKSENPHAQKRRHSSSKEVTPRCSPEKKYLPAGVKAENGDKHSKSWCGYPVSGETLNSQTLLQAEMNCYPPGMLKGHMPPYKAGTRSEPDVARRHSVGPDTGRHSVGSMSASSVVSVEASASGEEKPLAPQRRPSVIQHTEYAATSPSPSLSPKLTSSEVFTSPKMNLLPTQLSYSLTGKVAEWLTKGVHEVVACKTPSTAVEKCVELHDKVMMPSSCKTPGAVGTGKVPVNNVKSKQSKSPRSKYSGSKSHRNASPVANGIYPSLPKNDVRGGNVHMQKMLHPVPSTYAVMPQNPINNLPKYQQTVNQKMKMDFYPNGPYCSQSKRYKANATLPSAVPPARPSPSPFVRQQTYCTPPFSDVPKPTPTTHNDYESAVLDLSIKKKPPPPQARTIPPPPVSVSPVPEGVCLDLSIKKKPVAAVDNGIENITPPLPLSPNPPSQVVPYMNSSLKPLPTLIALQDLAAEEARRGYPRLPPGTMPGPPLVMPGPPVYHGSTHSKMSPGLVSSLPPVAYSKDMAKNLFIPSNARHSQFSPYVIPPFFSSNWTSVVSASAASSVKPTISQTSPMTYKDMVNHSVFPKEYPYNVKSQYHPVLCKDSGHYPSNDNK